MTIEIVHARSNECKYEALSYVWGTRPVSISIEVKGAKDSDPKYLEIGENLYGALLRLRGTEGRRTLWIDALCIDQRNLSERSLQVRRMGDVFGEARSVIIWLGEAADDSGLAIRFIQNLKVGEFDRLSADGKSVKELRAVAMLMRRPWFTRRWIVQEVAFAKEARVICGPDWIYWDTFSEGITLFAEKFDRMPNLFPLLRHRYNTSAFVKVYMENQFMIYMGVAAALGFFVPTAFPEGLTGLVLCLGLGALTLLNIGNSIWFSKAEQILKQTFPIGKVRGVGAHALVMALERVFRKEQREDNPERLCTMEELLSSLTAFQASKPHDVIYAVASLAKDSIGLIPDYKKPLHQVCIDVIDETIQTSQSLNIICRPWAPVFHGLPSWIPQASGLPFAIDSSHVYVRRCADPLVGFPQQRTYNACGSKLPAAKVFRSSGELLLQNNTILSVRGLQLPNIEWVGDPATAGRIPSSWVALRVVMRDQFWRTLVANRDQNGNMPPPWYRRASEESCERSGNQILNTTALLEASLTDPKNESSTIVSFLRRVQSVVWNRRLVKLQDGSLGLVPERVRLSDTVCILYGCDVPVILRHGEDGFWEFIGEAYVHGNGVMDGDAVNKPRDDICFNLK
jgi:hypothetical protein